ncbi:unnamed protein product [Cochlearia groenlandica]
MFKSLVILFMLSLSFTLETVAAESYCHAQRRVLVNQCKGLVFRRSPTPGCCVRIRKTPMWCVCSIVTPQLAALVNPNDLNYIVGVIRQCGRPVPHGTKCGSKCIY